MAKRKMKVNYKQPKRERKEKKEEVTIKDQVKSTGFTLIGILVFLGICFGCMKGLEALHLFEKGYTAPQTNGTEVTADYIIAGNVFNRKESSYLVLFDYFDDAYKVSAGIKQFANQYTDAKVYKVNLSNGANKNIISEEENTRPTNPSELKVNGVTLMKISNGRVVSYLSGEESVNAFFDTDDDEEK